MKKNECDFVKMKFHLDKNYVEWICIMQVELNATQLNLNSSKVFKIEFKYIEWNSNFIELNRIEILKLNQAQYSFFFGFNRINVPIEIQLNWI
jgi:hypothetical protein